MLAEALAKYRGARAVVLGLPRGGLPVAEQVASALHATLDLVMVRKIGVPGQPELAMGAVVDGPAPLTVRNEDVIRLVGVTEAEFDEVRDRELAEIRRRRIAYLGTRPHPDLSGRIAIVVDDGIATGASMRAALRAVRKQGPKKLVLAVPVAPTNSLLELREEADQIVCLEDYRTFGGVGEFYDDFREVTDQEVKGILAQFPAETGETPAGQPTKVRPASA
jgi:predicted phosphoribosyltransferase